MTSIESKKKAKPKMVVAELIAVYESEDHWMVRCLSLPNPYEKGDYKSSNCAGFPHGLVKESDLD